MDENHPALVAARSSWKYVQAKRKEEWLGLMADDAVMEDPIGVGPTNPRGLGVTGKAALREFYETNMEPNTIRIQTHESFAAGMESAHVLTLATSFPNGVTMTVHGIFTYTVDEAGKIRRLRGYWALEDSKIERRAE